MAGMLEGKIAIVTGAGGGIGREASRVLAEAGAHVIVSDIAVQSGEETVAAIRGAGLSASFFKADLASETDIQALVEHAVRTHGRLDGAFNNAGLEQCARVTTQSDRGIDERSVIARGTEVFDDFA